MGLNQLVYYTYIMSKILLLFPKKRKDLFYFFEKDKKNKYYLLDDDDDEGDFKQLQDGINFIADIYHWKDYTSPKQLLRKINPDKIIFGEIFDIKQIALCIYANSIAVPTFFIDHGVYGSSEEYTQIHASLEKSILKNKLKKIKNSIFQVIKNRFFYYSVTTHVSWKSLPSFLKLPLYSFIHSTFNALIKLPFKERTPAHFILFCKQNIDRVNQIYFAENKKVHITGFPYYDFYSSMAPKNDDYIVYIDHPYLEVGYLGWDKYHHEKIAKKLNDFAKKNKTKIYVKLHPKSNILFWKAYELDSGFIEVLQFGNFENLYLNAKLLLSYSSSLLIGFLCAKKNVVLLGWHPTPQILGINYFDMNLCHLSLDINELENEYHYWLQNNICKKNQKAYSYFIENYNFPFDGHATERILNLIDRV